MAVAANLRTVRARLRAACPTNGSEQEAAAVTNFTHIDAVCFEQPRDMLRCQLHTSHPHSPQRNHSGHAGSTSLGWKNTHRWRSHSSSTVTRSAKTWIRVPAPFGVRTLRPKYGKRTAWGWPCQRSVSGHPGTPPGLTVLAAEEPRFSRESCSKALSANSR